MTEEIIFGEIMSKQDGKKEKEDLEWKRMTGVSGEERHPVYHLSSLTPEQAKRYMERIGCSVEGGDIMKNKFSHLTLKAPDLTSKEALILKQEMLSAGGEAAIPEAFLKDLNETGDVMLSGTPKQLLRAATKLRLQPFGLPQVSAGIRRAVDVSVGKEKKVFRAGDASVAMDGTQVMGILNVTPDSFSDGGEFYDHRDAVEQGLGMEEEGAAILDIGGESSRPFSEPVSAGTELERIMPVMEELSGKTDLPISVDTYKADVAQEALENGACIVNDIYAMRYDEDMAEVIRQYDAGVVLMHMKGTPADMQEDPYYDDVIKEIFLFLKERAETAREAGIDRDRIMVDPGIGFGKRVRDNLEILREIGAFSALGYQVLVGPSRKGFIGKITGRPVTERVGGTVAVSALAATNGADVLRVHDVGEVVAGVKLAEAVGEGGK